MADIHSLPPGVSPVDAARAYAAAWKVAQGARNHRARLRRRQHRTRIYRQKLVGLWARFVAPYHVRETPRAEELLSSILAISEGSTDQLLRGRYELSARNARLLADDLRRRYDGVPELIRNLEQYAAHREAAIGRHVPRRPNP